MTILQLTPFDILTADPGRLMAPLGFWAGLPRLVEGAATARLLMVADNLSQAHVVNGFHRVAVAAADLPPSMRWYRSLYEAFLRQTVQTTRYMKLYLILRSRLDDESLIRLLGTYGVRAEPLTEPIPLPFQTGEPAWNRVTAEGQTWAVVRSKLQQVGSAHPRMLHRLFALDFPVWAALDIFTYTTADAMKLLQQKQISALYERGVGQAADEAESVTDAVRRLRFELNRVGAALHTVRLSVAVGAPHSHLLTQRLEMVRGTAGLEMEGWESNVALMRHLFSAEPPKETGGAILTSTGLCIFTGSALSYRRRTNTIGALAGVDQNQAPVVINVFDDRNPSYNSVVLGQTGAGKSFGVLLLMLRHLLMGVRLIIIDPQGNIDLSFLGEAVTHKAVLGTSAAAINILDMVHGEIANQVEGVLAIFAMLGITSNSLTQRAVLDEVLMDIYRPLWGRAGVGGADVPHLAAVQVRLAQMAADSRRPERIRQEAASLAFTLAPYVTGSRAALFGRQTTVDLSLDHPVTIFDISRLPKAKGKESNLRAALLAILVADINQAIRRKRREGDKAPILFFVDEMGILMREPVIASYISEEYKTARSRRVGMIVADQDLHSFLGPADESGLHHGVPMLANAAFQFIFMQQSGQKGIVREHFPDIPEALIAVLPTLPQGACIAKLPDDLLRLSVTASPFEQAVLSSRLQDRARAQRLMAQMVAETLATVTQGVSGTHGRHPDSLPRANLDEKEQVSL